MNHLDVEELITTLRGLIEPIANLRALVVRSGTLGHLATCNRCHSKANRAIQRSLPTMRLDLFPLEECYDAGRVSMLTDSWLSGKGRLDHHVAECLWCALALFDAAAESSSGPKKKSS